MVGAPTRTRTLTALALAAGAVALVAAGAVLAVARGTNAGDQFALVALAAGAAAAVLLLPAVEPAYPISFGLLLSMFSGNWAYLGVPVGLDRPVILYGIAAAMVKALGTSGGPRLIVRPLHVLLLAVATYAVGSALFAGTLFEQEPFYALLDRLGIIGFLLLFVAPVAFSTQRSRDVLLITLIAMGAYLGLTALFERAQLTSLVFPSYINNPGLGIHFGRARGPFLEAAADGLALFTCGVAALMGVVRWRGRRLAGTLCWLTAVLCAVGIFLTLTRQIWVGGTAAALVTMVATRELRRYVLPTVAVGVVAVLAALAFVPGLQASVSGRTNDKSPVWDRYNSDLAALRMLDVKPLLGFGWYTFGTESLPYYRQAATYPLTTVGRPHNVVLSNITELGLVGGLAWLVALLWALTAPLVRRGPPELRLWRIGLLAVGLCWLVVSNFTPLGYAFANHVLWLWAGVCAVPLADDASPADQPATAPAWRSAATSPSAA